MVATNIPDNSFDCSTLPVNGDGSIFSSYLGGIPALTGSASITGTEAEGNALSITVGTLARSLATLGTPTYQWYRTGVGAIAGATLSSYTTVLADVGYTIYQVMAGTDSNGNPWSYTTAATGAIAGAAVGVTTIWNDLAVDDDHGNAGYIAFVDSRVEMSATGTAVIKVQRRGGFAGAVTVDLSTYNTTGDCAMNSTTHFTAVTGQTVSFANQEIGEKSINVTVGTAPAAGLHTFGVTMDNATGGVKIRQSEMHIYFDDGGTNPSATTVTAASEVSAVSSPSTITLLTVPDSSLFISGQTSVLSGFTTTPDINGLQTVTFVDATTISIPVDVSVVTVGTGLVTDAELEQVINAASAGDLIYGSNADGSFFNNYRKSGSNYGGNHLSSAAGTKTAPIIVAEHPSGTPVIDQQYQATHDLAGYGIVAGFYLATGVSYLRIKGWETTRTLTSGLHTEAGGDLVGVVFEDCHIHDIGNTPLTSYPSGSVENLGAINNFATDSAIIRNNTIHDIYSSTVGGTSNAMTAEPYALAHGMHGFDAHNAWIENNTFYNVQKGVYHKNPNQDVAGGRDGYWLSRNKMYNLDSVALHIGLSGGSQEPAHNCWFTDNEIDKTGWSAVSSVVFCDYRGDALRQSTGLVVAGNTMINGGTLFQTESIEGVISYNNVLSGGDPYFNIRANSLDTAPPLTAAVSAVSVANPSQLTVPDSSIFVDGQLSTLAGFTTTPDINGVQTVTIVNGTTLSIPVNVTSVTDGVGTASIATGDNDNSIIYSDYNCFNGIANFYAFGDKGVDTYAYFSLANWQAVTGVAHLPNSPDANTITTAPTFVSSGTGDYRTTNLLTSGRSSQPIGIGSKLVGVQ